MGVARIAACTGAVDGVNVTFFTPTPYSALSLVAMVNGQAKVAANDDGFIETNPATGEFTLKEAPLVHDVIQAFYIDTTPDPFEGVEPIVGVLIDLDFIAGVVRDPEVLVGRLHECED